LSLSRRHIFPGQGPGWRSRCRHASELRPAWGSGRGRSSARTTAAIAAGYAVPASPLGDRVRCLYAQYSRDGRGVPSAVRLARRGSGPRPAPEVSVSGSVVDRFLAGSSRRCCWPSTAYRYGGKDFDKREAVREIAAGIPSLERVVTFGLPGTASGWGHRLRERGMEAPRVRGGCRSTTRCGCSTAPAPPGCRKPIVHGHGGILLEQIKEGPSPPRRPARRPDVLVLDDRLDDVELHRRRAADRPRRSCCFDGQTRATQRCRCCGSSPRTPGSRCSGTSAAFVSAVHEGRRRAAPRAGRSAVVRESRSASTGSPLSPEGFGWLYEHPRPPTLWLFSTSGGTRSVHRLFVGGVPTLPVYQGRAPGRGSLGCGRRGLGPGRPAVWSTR